MPPFYLNYLVACKGKVRAATGATASKVADSRIRASSGTCQMTLGGLLELAEVAMKDRLVDWAKEEPKACRRRPHQHCKKSVESDRLTHAADLVCTSGCMLTDLPPQLAASNCATPRALLVSKGEIAQDDR